MTKELKKSIFSMTREEIRASCKDLSYPSYRAEQLSDWLFSKREFRLQNMMNLPKSMRQDLAEKFDWSMPTIHQRLDSPDGASKLLLKGSRQQLFEAVILRYDGRTSLCIFSSGL